MNFFLAVSLIDVYNVQQKNIGKTYTVDWFEIGVMAPSRSTVGFRGKEKTELARI